MDLKFARELCAIELVKLEIQRAIEQKLQKMKADYQEIKRL